MSELLDSLRKYFDTTPKEILEKDLKELEPWNEIGPNAEEYCNWAINNAKLGNMKKYILVGWPEIQDFMEHPRWEECIFCESIKGHECPDNTYAVPEDLYNEIYNIK